MRTFLTIAFAVSARADDVTFHATQTDIIGVTSADNERLNSTSFLDRIHAEYAYARNITGKGVTIALIDSGIDANHREFNAPGKLAQGFNAITGTTDVMDKIGHGTHVAGIIGAERDGKGIFGIAYDAQLLPIKVLPDIGSGSSSALDHGLRYAIGKAAIVNMSLSANVSWGPAAMREAVQSGLLIVAAAGNESAPNPGWPARFAKEPWADNQIIAVGAVDASNRIAWFSNRAGDTAAWYLVAPGTQVTSSYPGDRYMNMSGTSMATPAVSGAAALIKQMWPSLQASQIANILFVTATDLGAPGIDPIYGRGLLNVEKALQPIGTLTTTTLNGRTISVLSGSTQVSAATSKLWRLAASGQLRAVGLDDYRRDFMVDLGAGLSRPASMSLEQVFDGMKSRIETAEQVLPDGSRLWTAQEHEHAVVGDALSSRERMQRRMSAFSLLVKNEHGREIREMAIGAGGTAAQYFGAGGLHLAPDLQFGTMPSLAHPYFNLLPSAAHTAIGQQIGDVKLKIGALTTGFNPLLESQDVYLPPSGRTTARANAALFEVSRSFGNMALSVSFAHINESNGYLGSYSNGPLTLGSNTSTKTLQISAAVLLTPKLALAGQAAYGVTPGSFNSSNLVTEISQARTNAFALALVASDNILAGDRFSMALSQPLRTYGGEMAMDVFTGLNDDGSLSREQVHFSMVPAGRELRAEMHYFLPAGRDASLGFAFMLRREPNNLIDAAMEKLLAVRYVKQF